LISVFHALLSFYTVDVPIKKQCLRLKHLTNFTLKLTQFFMTLIKFSLVCFSFLNGALFHVEHIYWLFNCCL